MKKGAKSSGKRVFVTGGLGYIGSTFAKEALKRGYNVLLLDSLLYEQDYGNIMSEILRSKSKKGSVELVIGDTRNIGLLEQHLKCFKPNYVLHIGELSSVYACNHNPALTEDINYISSKKVLDLCEKLKIPVLYNSTSSLYGNQKIMKLMKEDDPLPETTDNYCKYKLLMENYIKEKVAKNKKFKIIVFRPATVCGLSPRMRMDLLPNHFTYCAVAKGSIKISEPKAYRAAIDVQNLVDGYFKVIEKGSWQHLIYNIGHYNLSKEQFAEGIRSQIPCRIVPIPDIGDSRNLQIDCTRFDHEFDFHPRIGYKETVGKLIEWYKANRLAIEKANFAGYINSSLERWLQII